MPNFPIGVEPFGARNMGFKEEEVKERVERYLKTMGAKHLRERVPFSLSSGEKKRVALAGVLSMGAEALLLDEPTAGLDPRGEAHTQLKKLKIPIVIATHSPEVQLKSHPGLCY